MEQQRPPLAAAQAGTRDGKARAPTPKAPTLQQSQSTTTPQLQLQRCSRRVALKARAAPRRAANSKPKPSAQLKEQSLSGEKKRRGRPKKTPELKTPELKCPPPACKQPSAPRRYRRLQKSKRDVKVNASSARPPAAHERNSDDNSKLCERANRQAEVSDLSTGTFTAVWVLRLLHVHLYLLLYICIVHE